MSDLFSPTIIQRIVGVIDLKNQRAVHAVAGDRDSYQSVACCQGDPLSLAAHYRGHDIDQLYLADLDSIGGATIQTDIIRNICQANGSGRILIDVGWTGAGSASTANEIASIANDYPQTSWIAATESMQSIAAINSFQELVDPQRLFLGLDFFQGRLSGSLGFQDSIEAALRCSYAGAVVLDLAAVGRGNGPTMIDACRLIKSISPDWELYSGGGIRDDKDVSRLVDSGCDRCLVATALHGIV